MSVAGVTDRGVNLSEDEAFLQALVANAAEGLLTIDTESTIVFANPALERILGYEPEELIGSPRMRIIPERLRAAHQAGLERYLETGDKQMDWTGVELPALHKDGHEVPVSVSFREHEYDGDRLFTGIITEIAAQKRRERHLREQKQALEEFAGVLTHDLRNPLSVARSNLELACDTRDSEELRTAAQALDRMSQIINDTLAQSKHDGPLTTEPIPLGDLVEAAWESVLTGDAHLESPDGAWQILAHPGRARQALENLLRNAVTHAGPAPTVRIGILDDGPGFYVADDGPGFPDAVRAAVESNDQSGGGYGLRICEQVAAEHGWAMRLTEAASGGARVEFTSVTIGTC